MTTSSLEALQTALAAHLLGEPSTIAQAVSPRGRIGVARRLEIYRHAYRQRLIDALRENHGHTALYVGDEVFADIAGAYVDAHVSRERNLRWYGSDFSVWLLQTYPDNADVGELATLDQALRRAFDGADAAPLALADAAALAPEAWATLALRWHPTCQRLQFEHNTLALWHALDSGQTPPESARLEQAMPVLVWRRELQPHFRSLGALEARAIDRLREGAGFAATCDALAAEAPEQNLAADVGTLLRRWLDDGLVVGFDTLV